MTDETVERFIKMMVFLSKRAHRDAREFKGNERLYNFFRAKSGAYLVAAKVARDYQKQDKKLDSIKKRRINAKKNS